MKKIKIRKLNLWICRILEVGYIREEWMNKMYEDIIRLRINCKSCPTFLAITHIYIYIYVYLLQLTVDLKSNR